MLVPRLVGDDEKIFAFVARCDVLDEFSPSVGYHTLPSFGIVDLFQ